MPARTAGHCSPLTQQKPKKEKFKKETHWCPGQIPESAVGVCRAVTVTSLRVTIHWVTCARGKGICVCAPCPHDFTAAGACSEGFVRAQHTELCRYSQPEADVLSGAQVSSHLSGDLSLVSSFRSARQKLPALPGEKSTLPARPGSAGGQRSWVAVQCHCDSVDVTVTGQVLSL